MTAMWTPAKGAATADTLLLGTSEAMVHLRSLVRRVATGTASVLITGPSGSGKERVAQAVHAESTRAASPFVAVNCGAIPRDLLESELFGHEKGSFTGAHGLRRGRFEQAHGGTLFLDEIGDMPADMQVKLLRVLEERTIERVGGNAILPIDVRIVSATHRDLSMAIVDQRFREDLYYRLAVFPIAVPSLAERRDDLPMLIRHFLRDVADRQSPVRFSPDAITRLGRHGWAGNVRELRNLVERAAILHPGETLGAHEVEALLLRPALLHAGPSMDLLSGPMDLRRTLHEVEGRYIADALRQSNGVVADAARLLGLQRTTLVEKMRRHG